MRNAGKLQARSVQKLREELRIQADNESVAAALRDLPPQQIARLDSVFALAERQLPVDPAVRRVFQEAGARRPAHLAARALRLGAGRLRRRRARAWHSRWHAALQLGQPEHEGRAASAAGLDVRLERAPADRSPRAARVPGGSRRHHGSTAVRFVLRAGSSHSARRVSRAARARSRQADDLLRVLIAPRVGRRARVRARLAGRDPCLVRTAARVQRDRPPAPRHRAARRRTIRPTKSPGPRCAARKGSWRARSTTRPRSC